MLTKIIYIAFVSKTSVGVINKIRSQVEIWTNQNVSVEPITDCKFENIIIKILYRYFIILKYFLFAFNAESFLYVRQTITLPFWKNFTKRRHFTYEVNADIKQESYLHGWFYRLLFGRSDSLLDNANKILFVSIELSKRYEGKGEVWIFPNSLSNILYNSSLPRNNNIVFVGSNYSWQGLDHLLILASHLHEYVFHFIGEIDFPDLQNVVKHGRLVGDKYIETMKTMSYAIGTLAFDRSGLTEGSPLKVRDYVSFDLPTIVGYLDSDFSNFDFLFNLNTNAIEENIKEVRLFLNDWRNRTLRDYDLTNFQFAHREITRCKSILSPPINPYNPQNI